MLLLSVLLNLGQALVLVCLVGLCRDLGALAHDLMDPTERARLVPPLAPNTLAARLLRWLTRPKDAPTFTFGATKAWSPLRKRS